jgi:hypothetical protein
MSHVEESSVESLAQQADAKRQILSVSLARARVHLEPANLSQEAAAGLKAAASDMLHRAAGKTKTQAAIKAVAGSMAVGALAVGLAAQRRGRAPTLEENSHLPDVPETTLETKPGVDRNVVRTAAALVAALTIGAVAGKLAPVSSIERNVLNSVDSDFRSAFGHWAKRQMTQLVQVPSGAPYGPVNALALGVGLLLAARNRK